MIKLLMILICSIVLSSILAQSVMAENEQSWNSILSPLKQFRSGIKAQDIQCNPNFILVIKYEDGYPACVMPNTANQLLELGWAKNIIHSTNQMLYSSHIPFRITALVLYSPHDLCLHTCPPNDFYLKINANSTGYLLGYDVCNLSSCIHASDLSILLPVSDPLKPNYSMIPLPTELQWKYGDNVNIKVTISNTSDNKTATTINLGNSTIVS